MDSQSKRQDNGIDRIRALPDAFVGHILSFLPTRYAVCTPPFLSKRWNNLWKLFPNLDFFDEDFSRERIDCFMKFAGSVLSSHGSLDIQKLRICIHHCENFRAEDFSRVRKWILAAIRHNVVELYLSSWYETKAKDELKLPLSLLKCKTLEVLSLNSDCITYPTPTRGCFPSLSVLFLRVSCRDDDSFQKFFSNLLVFEELTFDAFYLRFYNVLNMKICAPQLKRLRMLLKYPSNNFKRCNNIFISAPKLVNIKLTDGVLTNYFLESTECLEIVEIAYNYRTPNTDSWSSDHDEIQDEVLRFANRTTVLLEKCCHAKYLSYRSS